MPITSSRPPGLPLSLTYPEAPVSALLAGSALRFGDRVAFRYGQAQLTHAGLHADACRFAGALRAHGIGRGDTVALHLPNRLSFPVAYYGTLLAGATFSPANPLLPAKDLAAQLADCAARAVVTYGPVAAALEGAGIGLVITDEPGSGAGLGFDAFLAGGETKPPEPAVDVHTDLAHLAYTGGTTGRSKGVRLTHRNVLVNTLQYACWGTGSVPGLDDDGNPVLDQIGDAGEWPVRLGTGIGINLTPWFHAMGTIGSLNVPVLSGGTVVLHDRFDPPSYVAEAERLRVTSMSGAPALFAALLACPSFHTADLSSVAMITSGAAPMPHDMINALRGRFPDAVIAEGYGLTEATMGATLSPSWRSGTRKTGSVGVPTFDTEVKIVAAEGGEEPLPVDTKGEVCVRGPQVMAGYHEREAETAAVLVDGWLHTGDVGVLDEDGFLSIVDRKKDMLIYKGYNVYPRELEELLITLPEVTAAAVVGRPSPGIGESPVAFVVRAPGHDDLTESTLLTTVNAQVVPYKRLRELHFVESIPVSAAGKVLKRQLRERL
ncbi:long-chain acyl-CoA synthetase [Prauserella marina]|uniref:Long-chain acyl-CoA synthetase n=1 Tax=Prauserella marina TaxID=530584 RepID=A0A1G6YNT8_9PSEU|nr:AMP-binding protein [Prauserella marina]PWV71960.1 long-chain acyl-CoA synthetase [Prauserella marina]SDD91981.1 long-chain acyl-CoA synthetase [Prauserella marina]